MRYACLVYFDPKRVFDGSAEAEAVLRDGYATLNELRASGRLVSDAALQLPDQAMTVRVRDGRRRPPTARSWRPRRCSAG